MDSPQYSQPGTIFPSSGGGASEWLSRTGRYEDAGIQMGSLPSGKRAPLAVGIVISEPK
jgi:hypothetical protein